MRIKWVALAAIVVGGCTVDLSIRNDETLIACEAQGECPTGTSCDLELGRCIRSDLDDTDAPQVVESAITPARASTGMEVDVSLRCDEPLGLAPRATLDPGGLDLVFDLFVVEAGVTPQYGASLEVEGDFPEGDLTVEALVSDVLGNRATRSIGTLEIDTTPPAVGDLRWVDPPPVAGSVTVASFNATADADAVVLSAVVINGTVRTDLSVSSVVVGTPAVAVFTGAVDLADLGLSGTGELTVELLAADDLGNAAPIVETPPLPFDTVAPDTQLVDAPAGVISQRVYSIELTSADEFDHFECRLDGEPWAPCVSPWERQIDLLGPHTLEVCAVDVAGNRDGTPAVATWTIERAWAQLSAGTAVCGVATDTTLWCWGEDSLLGVPDRLGQLSAPVQLAPELGWLSVDVANSMACAVRAEDDGGSLWCWGTGYIGLGWRGTALAPQRLEGNRWGSVAVSSEHACAMTLEGELFCWGYNGYGQLGIGTTINEMRPAEVAGAWRGVTTAPARTCGVQTDGSLWCWGAHTAEPTQVGTETDWLSIDLGGPANVIDCSGCTGPPLPPPSFRCGLRGSGAGTTAWCWGWNDAGQLGDGTTENASAPLEISIAGVPFDDWVAIVPGTDASTCGVRADGSGWCWGANSHGLVDSTAGIGGTGAAVDVPTQQSGSWQSIETGSGFGCGILASGAARCWGLNSKGVLGNGRSTIQPIPTRLSMAGPWSRVAAGMGYGCAVGADSSLWCWGTGVNGIRGEITGDDEPRAIEIPATGWTDVAAGPNHACALRTEGPEEQLWCWGSDTDGIRGSDAPPDDPSTPDPVQVHGLHWKVAAAGEEMTAGIQELWGKRTLWVWGRLPNGAVESEPVQLGIATDWSVVDVGEFHLCGLRGPPGSAELWCIGDNYSRQCGVEPAGVTIDTLTHVDIGDDWVTIALGQSHSCGLRTGAHGNQLWCWGDNGNGRLGFDAGWGSSDELPLRVGEEEDWVRLASGAEHSCAIREDGSLWCWGVKDDGRLGPTPSTGSPVEVPGKWKDVWCGERFTCAVDRLDEIWCWGAGESGQLGAGLVYGPHEVVVP